MSTATLNIEKNKTLVPQLRFQEFDKEWELNKLGDITSWASGGTPPKDNPLFWEGDISWISASSMRGIVYSNSELRITSAGLKKGSKLAKKGSLLILVRGSMLFNKIPIGIVSKDVAFNQDVKSIVVADSSTSEFILNWFTAFEPKILNMVTGTGIGAGKLDLPDIKALKISLPALPEQQKIASFLSAVDEKIQQLSRKKELLAQYKKGVMQQLFSGKLRFKDENGNDYADWEDKKLGEVVVIKSGLSKDQNDNNTGHRVTRIETISKGTINLDKVGYIEKCENIEGYKINKGDILFSNINSVTHIGKTAIAERDLDLYHGMNLLCIRSIEGLNSIFLYNFLNTDKLRNYFRTICNQAVNQASINQTEIAKTRVPYPSYKEQQKIAAFLSSIDGKIESTIQQVTQTQTFKKGLLQQLFV